MFVMFNAESIWNLFLCVMLISPRWPARYATLVNKLSFSAKLKFHLCGTWSSPILWLLFPVLCWFQARVRPPLDFRDSLGVYYFMVVVVATQPQNRCVLLNWGTCSEKCFPRFFPPAFPVPYVIPDNYIFQSLETNQKIGCLYKIL